MEALKTCNVILSALMLSVCIWTAPLDADQPWAIKTWGDAHATFYGGEDASGTMGGACGYGNLYSTGYGTATTALSNELFNHGLTCGACFMLVCKLEGSKWCYRGDRSITVTATNSCPPGSEGGWCDPPRLHFDLSYPMFRTLAQPIAGVIPIMYKRVSCIKQGGIRFGTLGNPSFNYFLVYNVAGGGDVESVWTKGSQTSFVEMNHNWGQYWSGAEYLVGQAVSFKVTLGDGNSLVLSDVLPTNWQFGQSYEAQNHQNFD